MKSVEAGPYETLQLSAFFPSLAASVRAQYWLGIVRTSACMLERNCSGQQTQMVGGLGRATLDAKPTGYARKLNTAEDGNGLAEERGGTVRRSAFRPRGHHPVCALVPSIQA